MNVFIRFPEEPAPTYYARFTAPDPAAPGKTKRYLRNTFEVTKEKALRVLKQMAAAAHAGRFEALDLSKARHEADMTVAQLIPHYKAGARELMPRTHVQNLNSLRLILRKAFGLGESKADAVDATALSQLTGDLVYRYRQAVLDAALDEDADEVRTQQLCRTANSVLRQARSIFSIEMRTYYRRVANLQLPAGIQGFVEEPGFRKVAKLDYNKPNDEVLAATFKALPDLEKTDPNVFRAVWAALGFGLRKSEIAAAKIGWFIMRDGAGHLRGDILAKNGQIPDIICQLGAWEKLKGHLVDRPADAYLLEGHETERHDLTFRRASKWMAGLGWGTQKRIHEFRAYAICQVAEKTGDLIEAQRWARHASYDTTEQAYGRYIRVKGLQVELTVPEPKPKPTEPAPFVPRIVGAA